MKKLREKVIILLLVLAMCTSFIPNTIAFAEEINNNTQENVTNVVQRTDTTGSRGAKSTTTTAVDQNGIAAPAGTGASIVKSTSSDKSGISETYSVTTTSANELLLGDVNGDGKVNIIDYIVLKKYISYGLTNINMQNADINQDTKVNMLDCFELKKMFSIDDGIIDVVKLNKTILDLTIGQTETLMTTVLPETTINKAVTWESSNTAVATVDANGKVEAVASGTATIKCTASDGSGQSGSCAVTVTEVIPATVKVTSIDLNKTTLDLTIGQTEIFTTTVLPENASNKVVTWESSNTAVATVEANGIVKAVGVGKATIKCIASDESGQSATSEVTVTEVIPATVKVTSVVMNKTTLELTVGQTETFTTEVLPENASNKAVTWESSNTAVATVEANGIVKAVGVGKATITCTSIDGSNLSAANEVTVRAGATAESEFEFDVNTGTIIKYIGNSTEVVIPSTIKGVLVKSIGNDAFHGCSSLTSIIIPNSVTSIGRYAFYGSSSLTSIIIPNSVTNIWNDAFHGCSSLTSIIIPDSVRGIGDAAFYGCSSLVSITILGVPGIGNHAFEGCSKLTSIIIPNGLTSIGEATFKDCSSLTSITIPNSVTSIGVDAFYGCSGLTSITIPDGVTSIGARAFKDCSNLISITIPNGVSSIGESAFESCTKLGSITIPNSVTRISKSTFEECSSLTSINIPNSVTTIPEGAFRWCSSLKSITIPESVISIGDSAFAGSGLTSIVLSNSLTSIGESAFNSCLSLISITIPNSVTSIGESTFAYCHSLATIIVPNSVTSIRNSTFYDCKSLTNIIVGNSVTSIGESAFEYCYNLKSITIPDSVTSIEGRAFKDCADLKSIIIPNSVTNLGEIVFINSGLENITLSSGITIIGKYALAGCSYLKSITIPGSVTSIEESAFASCRMLTSISIPNSVTSIGVNAFEGCSSLEIIEITGNVTNIGADAFKGCDKAVFVVENERVKELLVDSGVDADRTVLPPPPISQSDFDFDTKTGTIIKYNGSETDVVIPSSIDGVQVTSIGSRAFYSKITSIKIPNSVRSIGSYAFSDCNSLIFIDIPDGVTSIGSFAFAGCNNVMAVGIASSVTSIGTGAFYGVHGRFFVDSEAVSQLLISELIGKYEISLNGQLITGGDEEEPITQTQKPPNFVICVGKGAAAAYGVGGSLAEGYAIDSQGNVASFKSVGVGIGSPAAGISYQVQISNAESVDSLNGWGEEWGGSFGIPGVVGAGIERIYCRNSDGTVAWSGIQFSIGPDLNIAPVPVEFHGNQTYTWVTLLAGENSVVRNQVLSAIGLLNNNLSDETKELINYIIGGNIFMIE